MIPDSAHRSTELIVIEVKSHIKANMAGQQYCLNGLAKLRLSLINGLDDYSNKYFCIKAEDDTFPYFIDKKNEAMQILHNAYLYDAKWVLLLIGDDFSRIIAGIFMNFDASLKLAWGQVLTNIYQLSIAFLYECPKEAFVLSEEQQEILQ